MIPGVEEGSVTPDYDAYCLSNIHDTVLELLGVRNVSNRTLPSDIFDGVSTEGTDKVVLVVLDGLGLREWHRQKEEGLIHLVETKGRVTPMTTVFPSTTAAALTTLVTGRTPQEHALVEWHLYLKQLDMLILTLPFSPAGERGSDRLLPLIRPSVLFKGETIFSRLRREGIRSYSFLNRQIAGTAYSGLAHSASNVLPYVTSSDLSVSLRRTIGQSSGPAFFYVYWSAVDTIEHIFGPNTEEAGNEAENISHALKTGFIDKLDEHAASHTIVLVTADHGQVFSPSSDMVMLNRYRRFMNSLEVSPNGRTIPPWGSPRDLYLQVAGEKVDDTRVFLRKNFEASALLTDEAVAAGLFGRGTPDKTFLERVGNVMLLPHGTRSMWYRLPGIRPPILNGQHGGLHPDEMRIPFAVANAGELTG